MRQRGPRSRDPEVQAAFKENLDLITAINKDPNNTYVVGAVVIGLR